MCGKIKVGIHYWRWKTQSDVAATLEAGIMDRQISLDELREYHGADGFSVVVPRD